jgi:hypothetical protein
MSSSESPRPPSRQAAGRGSNKGEHEPLNDHVAEELNELGQAWRIQIRGRSHAASVGEATQPARARSEPNPAAAAFEAAARLRVAAGWRLFPSLIAFWLMAAGWLLTHPIEGISTHGWFLHFPQLLLPILLLVVVGLVVGMLPDGFMKQFITGRFIKQFITGRFVKQSFWFWVRFSALTGTEFTTFIVVIWVLLCATPHTNAPLFVYVVAAGIFTFCATTRLLTPKGRDQAKDWFRDAEAGQVASAIEQIFFVLLIAALGIAFFGALTYALNRSGNLPLYLHNRPVKVTMADANLFFVQQLMTSVPFADLASPFKWTAPFDYHRSWFGIATVAFKIFVIAPSIAFVYLCVKFGPAGHQPPTGQMPTLIPTPAREPQRGSGARSY